MSAKPRFQGAASDPSTLFTAHIERGPWTVYGLINPATGFVFYIGQSVAPLRRYVDHLTTDPASSVGRTIEAYKAFNLSPALALLGKFGSASDALAYESGLIRRHNGALVNEQHSNPKHWPADAWEASGNIAAPDTKVRLPWTRYYGVRPVPPKTHHRQDLTAIRAGSPFRVSDFTGYALYLAAGRVVSPALVPYTLQWSDMPDAVQFVDRRRHEPTELNKPDKAAPWYAMACGAESAGNPIPDEDDDD